MNFTKPDFSKVYRIEAIPSKDQPELAKKGIGAFPGTTQVVSVGYDRNLQKATHTGLDENAPEVLMLDGKEKEDILNWILENKKSLESKIGKPGYLDPTSDGWFSDLCTVYLETRQDLKISVNGHDNYLRPAINHKDAIALLVLYNNPFFPKSKRDVSKPEYKDSRFYITTDDELNTVVKNKLSTKKKVYVYLSELFEEGANTQKPWEVAYYMDLIKKKKSVKIEQLELQMDEAINSDDEMMKKFIEASEMPAEKLILLNMFKKGIEYGVIKYGKDGMYFRGAMNYRTTIEASVEFLQLQSNATELAGLKEAVDKEEKRHNK
jgi:hypothetical protein